MAHTAKEMMNRMKKHPTEEKNIITNHLSKKKPSDKGLTSRFVSSPPKKNYNKRINLGIGKELQ